MDTKTARGSFPIVGIGASAGGLEAFSQFLVELPPDTGFAFVYIQHLDPRHKSVLADLLARKTAMPVAEAMEGMKVEPNHVYVLPPNANLSIQQDRLSLLPREEGYGAHLSIDFFLNSLAMERGSGAIGVILSGTASDGVFGLKAIKSGGGITFAQDESSAKYPGMPHSAIAAGCADFVMTPQAIAREIERIARHPYFTLPGNSVPPELAAPVVDDFGRIFNLLRKQAGVDFAFYKQATISRRIRRRMLLLHFSEIPEYVQHLQENPAELDALYHELLINVTTFFRDPESFAALKEVVFPSILKSRKPDSPVRVWVPGCSTGEEVYSVAMTFLEFFDDQPGNVSLQLFATDIDGPAIEIARAGHYGPNIVEEVSRERLERFFTKSANGYQINKSLRDLCIFAKQNVFKDPPFSRLDLISCRNVLIYFGPVLQKKVFSLFHYALKPSGHLFLGTAETIGEYSDLFRVVDQKNKIFAKKPISTPFHFEFPNPMVSAQTSNDSPVRAVETLSHQEIQREVDRMLLERFAPPGVVIDEHMDILLFRGKTGPFIDPFPGEASLNLLKLAKSSLQLQLRAVVGDVVRTGKPARKEIMGEDGAPDVAVEAIPVKGMCYLVLFESLAKEKDGVRRRMRKSDETLVLQQELAATREYLQSVIEQQETTNEELRSANEEIQSSNEELQSINEELETAKEELQSVNEELATVNEELAGKNFELTKSNSDLANLVDSANVPLVIVGQDFRIRRFSAAQGPIRLTAEDVGKSILFIGYKIPPPGLESILSETMKNMDHREFDIQDGEGRWYSMRVRPYLSLENRIDGAVIAFFDIDEVVREKEASRVASAYADAVIDALKSPSLILTRDLRVAAASRSYLECFGVSRKETVDNLLYRLGNGEWAIPDLRKMLENVVENGEPFDDFDVDHDFRNVGHRRVSISGRKIEDGGRREPLILMQISV